MRWITAIIVILTLGIGIYIGTSINDEPKKDITDLALNDNSSSGKVADNSDKGLSEFPKSALNDNSITTLDLSDNSLQSLPSEIGELTKIEVLILDNNRLEGSLPGEIRKMTNLRVLSAKNNNLSGVPAEIGQLSKLETIDFSNNSISGLPLELGNLTQLKLLDLTGNPVSTYDLGLISSKLSNTDIKTD